MVPNKQLFTYTQRISKLLIGFLKSIPIVPPSTLRQRIPLLCSRTCFAICTASDAATASPVELCRDSTPLTVVLPSSYRALTVLLPRWSSALILQIYSYYITTIHVAIRRYPAPKCSRASYTNPPRNVKVPLVGMLGFLYDSSPF